MISFMRNVSNQFDFNSFFVIYGNCHIWKLRSVFSLFNWKLKSENCFSQQIMFEGSAVRKEFCRRLVAAQPLILVILILQTVRLSGQILQLLKFSDMLSQPNVSTFDLYLILFFTLGPLIALWKQVSKSLSAFALNQNWVLKTPATFLKVIFLQYPYTNVMSKQRAKGDPFLV